MVWRSYLKRGCFCVAEKKYDNKSPWYRIQRRIQRRRDMKTWHVSSLTRRQSIALTWWEGVYGSISLCLTRHLPTVFPANCSWLFSLCNYLVVDSFRKSLPITSFHFEWLFSFGSSVLKKLKETWEDVIEIFLSQLRDICLLFSFWILSLFFLEKKSPFVCFDDEKTLTHMSRLCNTWFSSRRLRCSGWTRFSRSSMFFFSERFSGRFLKWPWLGWISRTSNVLLMNLQFESSLLLLPLFLPEMFNFDLLVFSVFATF